MTRTRILLIGKNGQVGWELERALAPLGVLTAIDYPEIDLAQAEATRRLVGEAHPDLIVNAAAYTAVDSAEREPELAARLNAGAPGILAEEAARLGAALIHYSTDYVFDGAKGQPYLEEDTPRPLSTYGRTKLLGEEAVQRVGGAYLILRTSWVYSLRRESFVSKVLSWARTQPVVRVAEDEVSCPTWCRMLAEATADLIAWAGKQVVPRIRERRGVYHLAGSGAASRLEWARAILALSPRQAQIAAEVQPAKRAEFGGAAERPAYSALDCTRFAETFGLQLPPWEDALRMAMEDARLA